MDYNSMTGRSLAHCGKILLKSGADPTFANADIIPPVSQAMERNPVSIRIYQHTAYYSPGLLTRVGAF
jgi:hypothetical protein